jgi:hypothetical protein
MAKVVQRLTNPKYFRVGHLYYDLRETDPDTELVYDEETNQAQILKYPEPEPTPEADVDSWWEEKALPDELESDEVNVILIIYKANDPDGIYFQWVYVTKDSQGNWDIVYEKVLDAYWEDVQGQLVPVGKRLPKTFYHHLLSEEENGENND